MMRQRQYMTASDAAQIAGVVECTIANWLKRCPDLGVKVMGRWRINEQVLREILSGSRSVAKNNEVSV